MSLSLWLQYQCRFKNHKKDYYGIRDGNLWNTLMWLFIYSFIENKKMTISYSLKVSSTGSSLGASIDNNRKRLAYLLFFYLASIGIAYFPSSFNTPKREVCWNNNQEKILWPFYFLEKGMTFFEAKNPGFKDEKKWWAKKLFKKGGHCVKKIHQTIHLLLTFGVAIWLKMIDCRRFFGNVNGNRREKAVNEILRFHFFHTFINMQSYETSNF